MSIPDSIAIRNNTDTPETLPVTVEVLDLVRLDGRGAVKATCRVRIGPLVIAEIKVVVPVLASRPFVSLPARKVGDDWQPIVSILSPTLEQAVSAAVLAVWRKGGTR